MPVISKCPKCRQPVTIPDGLDPDAEVRCPLCAAAYPLSRAWAEAPPALIPVDRGAITGPAADSEALLKSDLVSEPFHVPESDDLSASPAGAEPTLDVWQKVDVTPQIDTGAVDTGAVDTGAVDTAEATSNVETFAIAEEESGDQRQPIAGDLSDKRRRKKDKSIVRHLVEVVGGGLLGLLIGYYILCWIGPSSLDLPKLPLPLLPHTMDKPATPKDTGPAMPEDKPPATKSSNQLSQTT